MSIKNVTAYSITLVWNQPHDNGAPVTQYSLEMCGNPSSKLSAFSKVYVGDALTTTVDNLTPAKEYSFRAFAANAVGFGTYSEETKGATAPSAPDPPQQPSVVRSDATSVTMQWSKPIEHGSPITSYSIQIDGSVERVSAESVPDLVYTISKLVPKQKYKIRVQATNKIGDSQFSKVKSITTGAIPPPQPKIDLVGSTHKELKIRWRFPKEVDAISSVVEMRNWWGGFEQVYSGTMLKCNISKLAPGRTYTLRASGINDAGQGLFGPPGVFTTPFEPVPSVKPPHLTFVEEGADEGANGDDDENTPEGLLVQYTAVLKEEQVFEVQAQRMPANDPGTDASEENVSLTVLDDDDSITKPVKLGDEFAVIYTGNFTRVLLSGVQRGSTYAIRIRVQDNKSGQAGSMCSVSELTIPARPPTPQATPTKGDDSDKGEAEESQMDQSDAKSVDMGDAVNTAVATPLTQMSFDTMLAGLDEQQRLMVWGILGLVVTVLLWLLLFS